ncbi:MAG: spherulation-specific family 4 protein, partial [Streptosporangiaceae bacterium]
CRARRRAPGARAADMAHTSPRARPGQRRRTRRRSVLAAVLTAIAAVAAVAAVALLRAAAGGAAGCQRSFIPAYFYGSRTWAEAAASHPPPAYLILDISGLGAGTAPDPHFRAVVRTARSAGAQILGYSSTAGGTRPASQVVADVRHYRAWYGVRNILLDVVSGTPAGLPYYRQLSRQIRQADPGSQLWFNPGRYPDRRYLALANVIVVFEGPYASYPGSAVPRWASGYPASRFAATIYATPPSSLASAVGQARARRTGYVYVTTGTGANPYAALPPYWNREASLVAARCPGG